MRLYYPEKERIMRISPVLLCLAALLCATPTYAAAEDLQQQAGELAGQVDGNQVMRFTTGINPDDYPCARAAIMKLYESRAEISRLSDWHPRKIFTWMQDTFEYYSLKITRWVMGLFNGSDLSNNAITDGLQDVGNNIVGAARGGGGKMRMPSLNSLDSKVRNMDSQVESWLDNLGPRSQTVVAEQVKSLIARAYSEDGFCK